MKYLIAILFISISAISYAADWKISTVTKSNVIRTEVAKSDRYLYISLNKDFTDKNHKYRIIKTNGELYRDLWGWKDNNTLVFEGDWNSLQDLWLDGNGHKEPLFEVKKIVEIPVTAIVENSNPIVSREGNRITYKNGDVVMVDYAERGIARPDRTIIIKEDNGNKTTVIDNRSPGSGDSGSSNGSGAGSKPDSGSADKNKGEDCDDGPGPGPGPSGEAKSTGSEKGEGEDCGDGKSQGTPSSPSVASIIPKDIVPKLDKIPDFVLYIATADEDNKGKLYQVDSNGRVLGMVNLSGNPAGVALRRENGVAVTIPGDGGKVILVNENGSVSTILSKDKNVVHPISVAIPAQSDTVLLADNIADIFAFTTTEGSKTEIYGKVDNQKWTAQSMSIATCEDKAVLYGTDTDKGIYRILNKEKKQILPDAGSVAADNKSEQWAATQDGKIYIFEGEEVIKQLRLPANKQHYRRGMLSFSPAKTICVAVGEEKPWLFMYNIETEKVRSLFPWERDIMTGFVVGPRMRWENNNK